MLKLIGEYVSDWEEGVVCSAAEIDLLSGIMQASTAVGAGHHTFSGHYAVFENTKYRLDDDAWNDEGILRIRDDDLAVLRSYVSAKLSLFAPASRAP